MSQANTEDTTRRDGSRSSEGLGPLPEPMKDYPEPGERTYTEDALLAFGAQERAAERERCLADCDAVGDLGAALVAQRIKDRA